MAQRKGLGKGQGKGYKNIQQWDSPIHSQSAKGIKQPQKIGNIDKFAEQNEPKDNKQFRELFESLKKKEKSVVKKVKKKFAEFQEAQKQKKIKELEDVNHPTVKKMSTQKSRVEELRTQLASEDDDSEREKLNNELDREEEQLRNIQEDVTEIDLADFSDAELKTLAIRHQSGFALFGSDNRYQDELVRRIEARKRLEKSLVEARKKPVEKGLFEDLFG